MGFTQFDYEQMLRRTTPSRAMPADGVEKESDLHNDVLKECRNRGWICLHGSMAHRARRTAGEPDFVIMADKGRVFFCEGKAKRGKLSPEQLGMKAWAEKLGHQVHLIYSLKDFLDIVDVRK